MIIVNTPDVPGKEVQQALGMVMGSTIRAKHIGKDILAGFRQIVGGELREYTEMLEEAREYAMKKMIDEAKKLGADGIINVRFSTSAVMQGAAEILAYGTAFKFK